ncbi:MAG TPA: ABC transporter permease [Vicinamibacterales bacterium]|nr:ABC transporter permease [Vicinamibacterales bacterium]
MRALLQDLRFGARIVWRQPGYALLIASTLALAIGANTVIFSFANVLALRPLPLKDHDTLGWIFLNDPQRGGSRGPLSVSELLDYRASLESFESIAGYTASAFTMTGRGDAEALVGSSVTANLPDTWGLETRTGRAFGPRDDLPGAAPVVMLSHHFWVRRFNADASVVGQSLVLNGRPHAVIGVLQPDIEIGNLSLIDVWVPITLDPAVPRDQRNLRVSGRLKPGVSFEQAAAAVRDVSRRLQSDHPATNAGWEARLAPAKEAMTGGDTWRILALLITVVGFVLVIACANIANLVLARATGRRRELAVRGALGASRARMVRQLLTESMLLAAAGGLLGLLVAYGGLILIRAAAYEPFFKLVVIDRTVLLFTGVLAIVTPLVFSLLPALQASNPDLQEALKDSSNRAGGQRGRRSRSALVVAQLALAMMLLIVSGLLVRTMVEINRAPLGFDRGDLLTIRIELPHWRYTTPASIRQFQDQLLTRLTALPAARDAATTDRLPVVGSEAVAAIRVEGFEPARPQDRAWAVPARVSERFFSTAGIPVLAGRPFAPSDNDLAMRVAIINAEMARRYWGGEAGALGRRLQLEGDDRRLTVVGVTGNVLRADLRSVNPQIYLPARQDPRSTMAVLVRATDASRLIASARAEVRALDPDVPVREIRTLEEVFDDEMSTSRILMGMFIAFGALALVLAASGLYGVVSYSVSQRYQEIGIRMALGAAGGDIRRMIVRQTVVLVLVGGAIGLTGGAVLGRMLAASLLFQVSPSDPATYGAVVVILSLVALVAAYVPVRRAVSVDPLVALRSE